MALLGVTHATGKTHIMADQVVDKMLKQHRIVIDVDRVTLPQNGTHLGCIGRTPAPVFL